MADEFKPMNLAAVYQGADASIANALQANLMMMQTAKLSQDYKEEDALRQLATRSTTTDASGQPSFDLRSFTKGAYSINPMKAIGFEKAASEAEKAGLEKQKLQGDIDKQRMDSAATRLKLLNEGTTVPYLKYKELIEAKVPENQARAQVQPLYEQAVQSLVKSGLFTEQQIAGMKIPAQFDPMMAEAGMRQVLGAKEQLADYWNRKNFGQREQQHQDTMNVQIRGQNITLRGQNLTDARAKEQLAQQGLEVKQAEDGTFQVVHKASGQAFPVIDATTGKPMGANQKPLTEVQGNALAYGTRMESAEQSLDKLFSSGYTGPGIISRSLQSVPIIGEVASNTMTSITDPKAQQYWQAARNFVTASLRKESGAVISPSEFVTEYQKYFPQPNDTKEVLQQKAESRKLAIELMKKQAGPRYEELSADARRRASAAAPQAGAKPAEQGKPAAPAAGVQVSAGGQTFTFPDQAAADAFKKAAGL